MFALAGSHISTTDKLQNQHKMRSNSCKLEYQWKKKLYRHLIKAKHGNGLVLQNPLITEDKDGAQWEIARKSHATILNQISDYLMFGFILIRIWEEVFHQ